MIAQHSSGSRGSSLRLVVAPSGALLGWTARKITGHSHSTGSTGFSSVLELTIRCPVTTEPPERALIDEDAAPPEQVANIALGPRSDVGHRKHAAAEQTGDLGGEDAIVHRLAAVNGFHVKSVAEREGNLVVLAKVCEPIPRELTLATNDEARAKRSDGVAKGDRRQGWRADRLQRRSCLHCRECA